MKLLLYCAKAKPYLNCDFGKDNHEEYSGDWYIYLANKQDECSNIVNGKIVAECDFEVEEITLKFNDYEVWIESNTDENVILKQSFLDDVELYNYLGGGNGDRGYAIHIKNLKIFDKPKELSEYYTKKKNNVEENEDLFMDGILYTPIKSAPQNMMYAKYPLQNDKIIISIKPEWLCKILNKEKTIEVRKKVLKEMLK